MLRVGAAIILIVMVAGVAVSGRQTAQPPESRELVVLVLANGRPVTNATIRCRPGGIHTTGKDGTAICRFASPTDLDRLRVSVTAHAPGFAVEGRIRSSSFVKCP